MICEVYRLPEPSGMEEPKCEDVSEDEDDDEFIPEYVDLDVDVDVEESKKEEPKYEEASQIYREIVVDGVVCYVPYPWDLND